MICVWLLFHHFNLKKKKKRSYLVIYTQVCSSFLQSFSDKMGESISISSSGGHRYGFVHPLTEPVGLRVKPGNGEALLREKNLPEFENEMFKNVCKCSPSKKPQVSHSSSSSTRGHDPANVKQSESNKNS